MGGLEVELTDSSILLEFSLDRVTGGFCYDLSSLVAAIEAFKLSLFAVHA